MNEAAGKREAIYPLRAIEVPQRWETIGHSLCFSCRKPVNRAKAMPAASEFALSEPRQFRLPSVFTGQFFCNVSPIIEWRFAAAACDSLVIAFSARRPRKGFG
ncbi:unnamed protein product [Symbiodinium natans]|uniref:Uncharacterized protein n=1 Tax=Symbiodinium natans TaxID=878477 RepID=A0A812UVN5_9DINO|nr:unnamed protein product [Symbiodinium natans]